MSLRDALLSPANTCTVPGSAFTGRRLSLLADHLQPGNCCLTLGRTDHHGRWVTWAPHESQPPVGL